MRRSPFLFLTFALLVVSFTLPAAGHPQIRLPRLPRSLPKELPRVDRLPSLDDLLNRAPLTSSLEDAVTEAAFLDRFDPASVSPLLELPFGFEDGVTLVPGAWESLLQSYCLKAGTLAPTRGDGYLWAPLKGPRADVVRAILNRAARHPDIPQRDIQVLLWGIIARSKVSTLGGGPLQAARTLLDESQVASIDGSALDIIPDEWLARITGPIAGPVRRVLEAENQLRQLLANPGGVAYEELERVAVLHGVPAAEREGRELPGGRWSWHPDGFFIRFLPNGYTNLRLQIYSPEQFEATRGPGGALAELRDVSGATVRVESAGTAPARVTFTAAGGTPRSVEMTAGADGAADAGRRAAEAVARLAGTGRTPSRDVADVAALAAAVADEEASAFLQRALASAAGDAIRQPSPAAAVAYARYQSASLGGLFAKPLDAGLRLQRRGGGFGGGGGGSGGGGGGGGMGGGGRQRLGPSMRKYDDDNSLNRARKAVDTFGKGNNALSIATDAGGFFGMAIPDALFGAILDFNFDTYEKSIGALAGDPPRADFQEFARPAVGDIPRVAPSGALTPEAAGHINALARELVTANAYLQAAIVALDRHGGAVQAGDRVWATRQAHALTYLKREAGLLSLKAAEALSAIDAGAPENESRRDVLEAMREIGAHFASLPDIGPPW